MLSLTFGNSLGDLAQAAMDDLRADGSDLFDPVSVAVPSAVLSAFLKFRLAMSSGPLGGAEVVRIGGLLRDLGVESIGRTELWVTAYHLLGETRDDPRLDPVRQYLEKHDEERRLDLAQLLAALWSKYERDHPVIIDAWLRGQSHTRTRDEEWQRLLWQRAIETCGRKPLLSSLWNAPADSFATDRPLYIWGVTEVSPGFARVLARLSQERRVRVYAQNPCQEFWEDLVKTDADIFEECEALALWARAGHGTVGRLSELANFDFRSAFREPSDQGSLAALQGQILNRQPLSWKDGDNSLQIHVCPSAPREAEIIADDIWRELDADPSLRLSDVAILVADEWQRYHSLFATAFRSAGNLPWNAVDLPVASQSRIVEALIAIIELPTGSFERSQVLSVLTHPSIAARFGGVAADEWSELTHRLGIAHGADQSAHTEQYIEGDLYNWDQGIRRVVLGTLMSENTGEVSFGSSRYSPESLIGDQATSAARFALLARSILADSQFAQRAVMRLPRWREWFVTLIDAYLVPTTSADERAITRAKVALSALSDADPMGQPVPFAIARKLALRSLQALSVGRGELLADGVTIAPLRTDSVPQARLLYVAGLSSGALSSGTPRGGIDIGTDLPGIDDRDRQRYAFLRALQASHKLRLSYVGRDSKTGESVEPAEVVTELRSTLGSEAMVVHHRLFAHDEIDDGSRTPLSQSRRWRQNFRRMRGELEQHAETQGALVPAAATLRTLALSDQRRDLRRALLVPEVARREDDASGYEIGISQLRSFLESPLQGWAGAVLGLRVEDDDKAEVRDEPFSTSPMTEALVLRDVFLKYRRGDGELGDVYAEHFAALRRRGQVPTGLFAEVEAARHLEILASWKRACVDFHGTGELWSFGRARRFAAVDRILPPLVVGSAQAPIELIGGLQPRFSGAPVVLVPRAPKDHHLLRPFLDHLFVSAIGEANATVALIAGGDGSTQRLPLPSISRDDAHAYLDSLARELVLSNHDYRLPLDAVLSHYRRPKGSLVDAINKRKRSRDDYGPVRLSPDLRAPADAEDIVSRRLSLLLGAMGLGQ